MTVQTVNTCLAQWQNWDAALSCAPSIASKLSGGLTNQTYLLNSNIGQLVLRIHHPNSGDLGINRHRESVILRFLGSLNIGPNIVYQHPDHQYLVYSYIDGSVWSEADLTQPAKRCKAAN